MNKYGMPEQEYQVILAASTRDVKMKRKPGRPAGTGRPLKAEAEKQPRRTIAMTDETWTHCVNQSEGAGAYLRRLVEQDRGKK